MTRDGLTAPVVTCSAMRGSGLDRLWAKVLEHRERLTLSGELQARRRSQQIQWMWSMVEDRLMQALRTNPGVVAALDRVERAIVQGKLTPTLAAREILETFGLTVPAALAEVAD